MLGLAHRHHLLVALLLKADLSAGGLDMVGRTLLYLHFPRRLKYPMFRGLLYKSEISFKICRKFRDTVSLISLGRIFFRF